MGQGNNFFTIPIPMLILTLILIANLPIPRFTNRCNNLLKVNNKDTRRITSREYGLWIGTLSFNNAA